MPPLADWPRPARGSAPRGLTGLVASLALFAALHSISRQTGLLNDTLAASATSPASLESDARRSGDNARRTEARVARRSESETPAERLVTVDTDLGALGSREGAASSFALLSDRSTGEQGAPGLRAVEAPTAGELEPVEIVPTLPASADPGDPGDDPEPDSVETGRCLLVHDRDGRPLVTRIHGIQDGRPLVLLPDGQLGIPDRLVTTDRPFRPATMDEMELRLTGPGAPYAGFDVLKTDHYLVLYQSSEGFARSSANLLEDLLRELLEAFRKRSFAVHEPEFPLVAVIFRDEDDFRRHKPVAREVQAYYEILTNRISLFQSSDRDQNAPEVAALRKPQTVAHEGAHQILHNIGIQPRLAAWPLWLIEGLAEYCSPPTLKRGQAGWAGLGQVNPIHMATIRDLADNPSQAIRFPNGPRAGRDPRKATVEYLVTADNLSPTDYALSWALVHYLATRRMDDFLGYLKVLSKLPPAQPLSADDHRAVFRAAFGEDLARMDRQVIAHLSKLKHQDALPFYTVMFEQQLPGGMLRRSAMVSQSPSLIREWLETAAQPRGGLAQWQALPFPSKNRALHQAELWLRQSQ